MYSFRKIVKCHAIEFLQVLEHVSYSCSLFFYFHGKDVEDRNSDLTVHNNLNLTSYRRRHCEEVY